MPTHEVCWQHGDNDKMIFNVDGSILTNPGKVDYGGLVRSFVFYSSIGLSNVLHVEIRALMIEIKLC